MPRRDLLDSLPPTEAEWLRAVLVREELAMDRLLAQAGTRAEAVWLLDDAVTARLVAHGDGAAEESGLDTAGSLACSFALLGDGGMPWDVRVRRPGQAWRLERALFAEVQHRAPAFRQLAERRARDEVAQLAGGFAVRGFRNARIGVALRLRDHFDALGDRVIRMTHRELGQLLNMRRETVTLALQELEGARAIRNRRGEIELLDRALLAAIGTGGQGGQGALPAPEPCPPLRR